MNSDEKTQSDWDAWVQKAQELIEVDLEIYNLQQLIQQTHNDEKTPRTIQTFSDYISAIKVSKDAVERRHKLETEINAKQKQKESISLFVRVNCPMKFCWIKVGIYALKVTASYEVETWESVCEGEF